MLTAQAFKNVENENAQALCALWDTLQVPALAVDIGSTGYLDRVKFEQMTAPVMKGSDIAGRKFIAMRCDVLRRGADGQLFDGCESVLVVHERYSDSPKAVWVIAGDCGLALSSAAADYMPDAARIRALCNGEWVERASRGDGSTTEVICR